MTESSQRGRSIELGEPEPHVEPTTQQIALLAQLDKIIVQSGMISGNNPDTRIEWAVDQLHELYCRTPRRARGVSEYTGQNCG